MYLSLYVYIYIYIHMYAYVYVYICVCIYTYIYIYMHTYSVVQVSWLSHTNVAQSYHRGVSRETLCLFVTVA